MLMKDIRVGETYAFIQDYGDAQRKCSYSFAPKVVNANPIVVVGKETVTITTVDPCGRMIPTRKTILTAKHYDIPPTDMRAFDLDLVEKDDPKKVITLQVNAKDVLSPWEIEVERVRNRVAVETKMNKIRQYFGILACAVAKRLYELMPTEVETMVADGGGLSAKMELNIPPISRTDSLFVFMSDSEVKSYLGERMTHNRLYELISYKTELGFSVTVAVTGNVTNMYNNTHYSSQEKRVFLRAEHPVIRNLFMDYAVWWVNMPPPVMPKKAEHDSAARDTYEQKKLIPWMEKVCAKLAKTTQEERHMFMETVVHQIADTVSVFGLREDIPWFDYRTSWKELLTKSAKEVIPVNEVKTFMKYVTDSTNKYAREEFRMNLNHASD